MISALEAGESAAPDDASEALHFRSLQTLASQIASSALSPVDVTRYLLDRIARLDGHLKSYATVTAEQALTDARDAEREIRAGKYRGPLHGVPIAVKDLCYTKGVRTMGGTAVRRDLVPTFDSTVVSRLRSAGAVVLGKLNLSEGAAAGYNPAFDVPLNPWNPDRWPGMSSSGSGVALAAGLCFGAIGTDTGGSIRMPSSANGVVGLKPTYGRVSRYGVLAMAESLDHVGPMARRVADAALMLDVIAGPDPRDPTSLEAPPPRAFEQLRRGLRGVRIGLDRDYALKGIDSGQAKAIESAVGVLRDLGAQIVEVRMPDVSRVVETWQPICAHEMAAAHAATFPARAAEYGPYLREFLEQGSRVTPEQLAAASRARQALMQQLNLLLDSVDAMAGPAGGDPAWPITHAIQVGPLAAYHAAWSAAAPRSAEFTMPMDLAGVPAICLPSGFSPDGLPYSVQFTGRRLSEAMLASIAYAYETATPWHKRHPGDRSA
ncbi:MAG TPA: amidase [Steroidobacteraceae bacterium]|nr:amidase [Steroidobacteraceae bacterium]